MPNVLASVVSGWPLIPGTTIPFAECVRSPRSPIEEFRNDASRVTQTIFVPWGQREDARKFILGYPSVQIVGALKWITRNIPWAYPVKNSSGQRYVYATEVIRSEPIGLPEALADGSIDQNPVAPPTDASAVADWLLAKLTILYETYLYDIVTDSAMPADPNGLPDEASGKRYWTRTTQPGGRAVTVPATAGSNSPFNYVGGVSTGTLAYPSLIEVQDQIIIHWELVPKRAIGARSVNYDDASVTTYPIDLGRGHVNAANFPAGASNPFKPGTLLFENFTPTPIRSALGDRLYRCEFRFKLFAPQVNQFATGAGLDKNSNPIGHNHWLDKDGKYYEVTTDGNTNYQGGSPSAYTANTTRRSPYEGYDFNTMFRVP